MLGIVHQQQENTHEPNRDGDQKAPAEALLAKNKDLEPDGDERQRRFEHRSEAGRHVLLGPEHGAICDHEHQHAKHGQTSPLFACWRGRR